MAGSFIDVDVNAKPVIDALDRLLRATRNTKPAFQNIGEHLTNSTRARFDSETAPDGTPWAPLSAGYEKRKKRNKDMILTLHGYLRGSIHPEAWDGGAAVGTNRVYAAAMQFGMAKGYAGTGHYKTKAGTFPIPWGDIPARAFLGLSADDEREVVEILREHLRRAL